MITRTLINEHAIRNTLDIKLYLKFNKVLNEVATQFVYSRINFCYFAFNMKS